MVAAHVRTLCSTLHRAKMAKTMKGCLTAQSQPKGAEEPETNPSVTQQEEQTNMAKGNVIADYQPDIDHATKVVRS